MDRARGAHTAEAAGTQRARQDELDRRAAIVREAGESFGVRASRSLASALSASPGDEEFRDLDWEFTDPPAFDSPYGGTTIRPGHGLHFTMRTEFQGITVEAIMLGNKNDGGAVLAVANEFGSMGFSDLAGFGAAVDYRGLIGPPAAHR